MDKAVDFQRHHQLRREARAAHECRPPHGTMMIQPTEEVIELYRIIDMKHDLECAIRKFRDR